MPEDSGDIVERKIAKGGLFTAAQLPGLRFHLMEAAAAPPLSGMRRTACRRRTAECPMLSCESVFRSMKFQSTNLPKNRMRYESCTRINEF